MRKSTTFFTQLVRLIPKSVMQNAIRNSGADRRTRTFSARDHLFALLLGHLHGVTSLRHLVTLWDDLPELRQCLGMKPIHRSTLADANRVRLHDFFRAIMGHVLEACHREVHPSRRPLKRLRFSLDSTSIELAADLFKWARVAPERSAIKIHTLVRTGTALPELIHVGDGSSHDVKIGKQLLIPPGAIVSMDRAYVDGKFFAQLHDQGSFFVTRMKRRMKYRVIYRHKPAKGVKGVRADQEIVLTGSGAIHYGDRPLRRVRYHDETTGQTLIFLTNILDLAASTIARLYQERWQVELFFKWIKQHLKLLVFWGRSQNAVLIQIWVAMLAYAMISWIRLTVRTTWQPGRTLRYVQSRLCQPTDPSFWKPDPLPTK